MPTPTKNINETIKLQFVWKLPDRSYLRTVFDARITGLDPVQERYIVHLQALVASKEEDENGQLKPLDRWSLSYWDLVQNLVNKFAAVAYEAADSRPLLLRLSTLTLEHRFFTKFGNEQPVIIEAEDKDKDK